MKLGEGLPELETIPRPRSGRAGLQELQILLVRAAHGGATG